MQNASNASNANMSTFQTISDDVTITPISPARIAEKISSTPRHRYDQGVCAKFTRMDDKHGIKFYYKREMRDKTYELQNIAYEHGFAPKAFDQFELHSAELDRTVYGYVTETIKETFNDRYGYMRTNNDNNNVVFPDDADFIEVAEQFEDMILGLNEIMFVRDIHHDNAGFMPDGRMVAIDFSHCFTLDTPEDIREKDPVT